MSDENETARYIKNEIAGEIINIFEEMFSTCVNVDKLNLWNAMLLIAEKNDYYYNMRKIL